MTDTTQLDAAIALLNTANLSDEHRNLWKERLKSSPELAGLFTEAFEDDPGLLSFFSHILSKKIDTLDSPEKYRSVVEEEMSELQKLLSE